MKSEMTERFKEAYHYEKLAARSLLGPAVSGHLDVIENELKALLTEAAFQSVRDRMQKMEKEEEDGSEKKMRKIAIEDERDGI